MYMCISFTPPFWKIVTKYKDSEWLACNLEHAWSSSPRTSSVQPSQNRRGCHTHTHTRACSNDVWGKLWARSIILFCFVLLCGQQDCCSAGGTLEHPHTLWFVFRNYCYVSFALSRLNWLLCIESLPNQLPWTVDTWNIQWWLNPEAFKIPVYYMNFNKTLHWKQLKSSKIWQRRYSSDLLHSVTGVNAYIYIYIYTRCSTKSHCHTYT